MRLTTISNIKKKEPSEEVKPKTDELEIIKTGVKLLKSQKNQKYLKKKKSQKKKKLHLKRLIYLLFDKPEEPKEAIKEVDLSNFIVLDKSKEEVTSERLVIIKNLLDNIYKFPLFKYFNIWKDKSSKYEQLLEIKKLEHEIEQNEFIIDILNYKYNKIIVSSKVKYIIDVCFWASKFNSLYL